MALRPSNLTADEVSALLCRDTDDETNASSSSWSSAINANESDDGADPIIQLLQPVTIDTDYASGNDMSIKGDIDSYLDSCRSPCPFVCEAWYRLYTRPNVPLAAKNVKFTKYMISRHKFNVKHEPDFQTYRDRDVCPGEWFDFTIGIIDGRDLMVIFQMDLQSPFFNRVPLRSTSEDDGRSAAASAVFIKNVIARAMRRLDVNCEFSRAGSKFIAYDVSRTYNIMRADYNKFADHVADVLLTSDKHVA